jgi:hypothetical protein
MADLSDPEIARLVALRKVLPTDFRSRVQMKPKPGHKERDLTVAAEDGSTFRLMLRQSLKNPLDFSVIVAYQMSKTNRLFRLRRYNGRFTQHTNRLENETFYDFHIHEATARYQDSGMAEDTFARPTDRFGDLQGAIECVLQDCAFVIPNDPNQPVQESVLNKLFPDES